MTNIEKRKLKYPDTSTFHYYNANPKNKITGDCVMRALSTVLEIPYNQCIMESAEMWIKTGYELASSHGYNKYLESKQFKKMPQPRKDDNTKYEGWEFCKMVKSLIKKGHKEYSRIFANIGGHHAVAIIDGVVYDTWDSSSRGGCIGNYWIKRSD